MIRQLTNIMYDIGKLLLKWRRSKLFAGKWEGSQFKAEVDRMAHLAITERLKKIAPTIPIISEEDEISIHKKRPDYYWLIDPIDGTASFVGGFPGFVTQVALIKNGCPLVGAIYAPVLDFLYIAERGEGATLNNQKLCVSPNRETTILIDNYPEPRGVARAVYKDLNFLRYVECGSISLKICKIADRTADVFFKNVIVKDWDLAPAHLVLEEAGGVLRDVTGGKISYYGNYKQNGVIAVSSQKACAHVVAWYKEFEKREKV